jgi:hypothetical protein
VNVHTADTVCSLSLRCLALQILSSLIFLHPSRHPCPLFISLPFPSALILSSTLFSSLLSSLLPSSFTSPHHTSSVFSSPFPSPPSPPSARFRLPLLLSLSLSSSPLPVSHSHFCHGSPDEVAEDMRKQLDANPNTIQVTYTLRYSAVQKSISRLFQYSVVITVVQYSTVLHTTVQYIECTAPSSASHDITVLQHITR